MTLPRRGISWTTHQYSLHAAAKRHASGLRDGAYRSESGKPRSLPFVDPCPRTRPSTCTNDRLKRVSPRGYHVSVIGATSGLEL